MLCDPFGLDHSATDRSYPHLSLCGANSFLELDHSGSQPFMLYVVYIYILPTRVTVAGYFCEVFFLQH